MKTAIDKVNFGKYLHDLRMERQLPLRTVADKLGIDISLLSKIEHRERFVQGHMLESIALLFELDYKMLAVAFLSCQIQDTFGKEPFFLEAIEEINNKLKENN